MQSISVSVTWWWSLSERSRGEMLRLLRSFNPFLWTKTDVHALRTWISPPPQPASPPPTPQTCAAVSSEWATRSCCSGRMPCNTRRRRLSARTIYAFWPWWVWRRPDPPPTTKMRHWKRICRETYRCPIRPKRGTSRRSCSASAGCRRDRERNRCRDQGYVARYVHGPLNNSPWTSRRQPTNRWRSASNVPFAPPMPLWRERATYIWIYR